MEPSYVGIRQHLKIVGKFCESSKFTDTIWLRYGTLKEYARKFDKTKAIIFACIREQIRS